MRLGCEDNRSQEEKIQARGTSQTILGAQQPTRALRVECSASCQMGRVKEFPRRTNTRRLSTSLQRRVPENSSCFVWNLEQIRSATCRAGRGDMRRLFSTLRISWQLTCRLRVTTAVAWKVSFLVHPTPLLTVSPNPSWDRHPFLPVKLWNSLGRGMTLHTD